MGKLARAYGATQSYRDSELYLANASPFIRAGVQTRPWCWNAHHRFGLQSDRNSETPSEQGRSPQNPALFPYCQCYDVFQKRSISDG